LPTEGKEAFADNIDKENLPDGWKMGTIGDFCKEIKSSGIPSRSHNKFGDKKDYPWLKSGESHNEYDYLYRRIYQSSWTR
jgi:type I restriction-modification system specificity determinant